MILKADKVLERLKSGDENHLVIQPIDIVALEKSGSSSVDLRLGTRFLSTKHGRSTILDIEHENKDINKQKRIMEAHYVPFGNKFILHPRDFVLGVTLEWIKLPHDLSGYVQGRSSWGRRGLVIATAVGVHCGFSGCLTLELTNLGEIPIAIYPGMTICQLFLHHVETSIKNTDQTIFFGKSKPILGRISLDETAKLLSGLRIKIEKGKIRHCAAAIHAILSARHPACSNASPQASSVAPVVTTSSTNKILFSSMV